MVDCFPTPDCFLLRFSVVGLCFCCYCFWEKNGPSMGLRRLPTHRRLRLTERWLPLREGLSRTLTWASSLLTQLFSQPHDHIWCHERDALAFAVAGRDEKLATDG